MKVSVFGAIGFSDNKDGTVRLPSYPSPGADRRLRTAVSARPANLAPLPIHCAEAQLLAGAASARVSAALNPPSEAKPNSIPGSSRTPSEYCDADTSIVREVFGLVKSKLSEAERRRRAARTLAPIDAGSATSAPEIDDNFGLPTIRSLAVWALNTTPLGRIHLAALPLQVAVSKDLLQNSPCTRLSSLADKDNPRESLSARSARRRVLKQPFGIGYQPERPLAVRSISCRIAYGKILPVGRSWYGGQFALAIPMATPQVPR